MDPERTSTLFVSEGSIGPPSRNAVPWRPDHTKFTPRLHLVHMFSLQMAKLDRVMTRIRKGDIDDFPC